MRRIAPPKPPRPSKLQAQLLLLMLADRERTINMRWHRPAYISGTEVYRGALEGYRGSIYNRTFEGMLEAGWITRAPHIKAAPFSASVQRYMLSMAGAALATQLAAELKQAPPPDPENQG